MSENITRLVLDIVKQLDSGSGVVSVEKAGIDLSFQLRAEEPEARWDTLLGHVQTILGAIGYATGLNLSLRVLPLEPEASK